MKKKFLALLLVVALVAALAVGLTACNNDEKEAATDYSKIKIGIICLHGETSTYDKNFIDAITAVQKELGLTNDQVIIKTGIAEDNTCYETACDLADDGCNIIFADSFSHESYLMQAAAEYPDVEFCHATGTMAHTSTLTNFHDAFASIYEGRYLAGVAAGLKINEMIKNGTVVNGTTVTAETAKMGYVGAYTYAEVISGLTSFYLGAKSVCPSVTMDVKFTGSWYDLDLEKAAAEDLINDGCILISQHADSMGAPNACKAAGVPNVTYNLSTKDACPDSYLIGSKINWAPYFKYIINQTVKGEAIDKDWTGSIATDSVQVLEINENVAAAGTAAKIEEVKAKLQNGELNVFDCSTFTVGGKTLTTYKADVDTDADFTPDTEVVSNGVFYESTKRSAPYFNIQIDGINFLNSKY